MQPAERAGVDNALRLLLGQSGVIKFSFNEQAYAKLEFICHTLNKSKYYIGHSHFANFENLVTCQSKCF